MRFLLFTVAAAVAGCGGGGGGDAPATCAAITMSAATVGSAAALVIDTPTALTIDGVNNTRTISGSSYLCSLTIDGASAISNLIHFDAPMVVQSCELAGSGNMIEKPTGMALACSDSGIGNTISDY